MIVHTHLLLLAALLFCLGLFIALRGRDAARALAGAMLMACAGALNLIVFARFVEGGVHGLFFACLGLLLIGAQILAVARLLRNTTERTGPVVDEAGSPGESA